MGALRFCKNNHRFWIISAAAIMCLVLVICCLIRPSTPKDPTASWPDLAKTRQNYTAHKAEKDGCVVIDNSTLLAGEKLLADFVNDTAMGRPAAIRVYQTYSDQGDSYYVKELRYDGQSYHLQFYDRTGDTNEEFLNQSTYKYFKRDCYVWDKQTNQTRVCYLLFDNPEVTAQGYYDHIVSSSVSPEDEIYNHCHFLFSCDHWLYNAMDGFAYSDIDGDGIEEKCCLGWGGTSGLYSFSLDVYQGEQLEYEAIFVSSSYHLYALRFLQAEDRTLRITGVTCDDVPETYVFDLILQDGKLSLKEEKSEHAIPLPYPEPPCCSGETIPGLP